VSTTDSVGNHELRLALGMRGGVSLAVWIGGACAEIDALRRAAPAARYPGTGGADAKGFWRERLDDAGYTGVEVDVMAGASAGGLNAVLFAAAQHYGFPFEQIRAVWLRSGALHRLVRPVQQPDGAQAPPAASLLDGDAGFLHEVYTELLELIDLANAAPSTPGAPDAVGAPPPLRPSTDVRLSATLVEPIVRAAPSPETEPGVAAQQLSVLRSAASFRFRHTGGLDWMPSDFPEHVTPGQGGRAEFEAAVWRLALAARATSSFPGAFEPAAVRSLRPDHFGSTRSEQPGRFVDMQGVFSEAGPASGGQDVFPVLDGGWLDNIPLERAVQAISLAPAQVTTSRFLLYLHPGEAPPPHDTAPGPHDSPTAPPADLDRRRSLVRVARGMVKAVWSSETIAGDIAAIEARNRAIDRALVMRERALSFGDSAATLTAARTAVRSYCAARASSEAAAVRRLLDDPIVVLGEDPFPMGTVSPRAPLTAPGWGTSQREQLDAALAAALALALDDQIATAASEDGRPLDELRVELLGSADALVHVCSLLLEWVRYIEVHSDTNLGRKKQLLYRVLLFAEQVLRRGADLRWVVAASDDPPDEWVAEWTTAATRSAHGVVDCSAETASAVVRGLQVGRGSIDAEVLASFLPGAPQGQVNIATTIVEQVLVPLVAGVLNGTRLPPTADAEPAARLDRVLRTREQPDAIQIVQRLVALEVLCLHEFLTAAPGARAVRFRELSAANRTPLADRLTALHQRADEMGIDWPMGETKVPVKLKLAGNELMNFAAFLREEWRANDWLWGRLDAVPTLIRLLAPEVSDDCQNQMIEERQREILREELALAPWNLRAPVTDAQVDRFLADFDLGATTILNDRQLDVAEVFQRLGHAASDAIMWNGAQLGGGPGGSSSAMVNRVTRALAWTARAAGNVVPPILLAPTASGIGVKRGVLVVLGAVGAVAGIAIAVGALRDLPAALLVAGGVTVLGVSALGVIRWVTSGRALTRGTPPDAAREEPASS
jgi:patatin-related protein